MWVSLTPGWATGFHSMLQSYGKRGKEKSMKVLIGIDSINLSASSPLCHYQRSEGMWGCMVAKAARQYLISIPIWCLITQLVEWGKKEGGQSVRLMTAVAVTDPDSHPTSCATNPGYKMLFQEYFIKAVKCAASPSHFGAINTSSSYLCQKAEGAKIRVESDFQLFWYQA